MRERKFEVRHTGNGATERQPHEALCPLPFPCVIDLDDVAGPSPQRRPTVPATPPRTTRPSCEPPKFGGRIGAARKTFCEDGFLSGKPVFVILEPRHEVRYMAKTTDILGMESDHGATQTVGGPARSQVFRRARRV